MTEQLPEIVVRPRVPADLPVLVAILRRSHDEHRYPVRASVVRADWLAVPTELFSAVAERDGRVVGHVALHPAVIDDEGERLAVRGWSAATGIRREGLAVVSRLVTDGTVRGAGLALLGAAVAAARAMHREPVLLVDPTAAARGFYLRHGWREVGTARQHWGEHGVDAVLMVVQRTGGD
ncbi:GNAT family N-acetyltransferase [Klenkia sp. PcliD-1-E]|uniref:GNAT family N-acetyltransferase n=1 Tax=Klenkia sp. PcliD-1-E TaxID=2954492 RepID=UPI002097CD3F|nr:GNAT family N-acetyltransferase [Klenkia sp. PcliD-1-E]MCO7218931.1 GNAT family N-acetyltransferase [Klenkia sp. PcliD-1-E]